MWTQQTYRLQQMETGVIFNSVHSLQTTRMCPESGSPKLTPILYHQRTLNMLTQLVMLIVAKAHDPFDS